MDWKIIRLQNFRYAFEGIWYTLRTQRNAQIHLVAAILVIIMGFWLQVTRIEWAILALTIGMVIMAEIFNTAIEITMDHLSPEIHPQVKVVKDAAAGAVFVSALAAVMVGLLIFGPLVGRWLIGD